MVSAVLLSILAAFPFAVFVPAPATRVQPLASTLSRERSYEECMADCIATYPWWLRTGAGIVCQILCLSGIRDSPSEAHPPFPPTPQTTPTIKPTTTSIKPDPETSKTIPTTTERTTTKRTSTTKRRRTPCPGR